MEKPRQAPFDAWNSTLVARMTRRGYDVRGNWNTLMSMLYGNPRHVLAEGEARAALAAFDRLAILVTHGPDGLAATQIPIFVEGDKIVAHVARANPQWKHAPCPAMLIAQGAETYISPGWYETKKRTARAVPTWNY